METGSRPLQRLRDALAALALIYGLIQTALALGEHGLTMNFDLKHGIIFVVLGVCAFISNRSLRKPPRGIEP